MDTPVPPSVTLREPTMLAVPLTEQDGGIAGPQNTRDLVIPADFALVTPPQNSRVLCTPAPQSEIDRVRRPRISSTAIAGGGLVSGLIQEALMDSISLTNDVLIYARQHEMIMREEFVLEREYERLEEKLLKENPNATSPPRLPVVDELAFLQAVDHDENRCMDVLRDLLINRRRELLDRLRLAARRKDCAAFVIETESFKLLIRDFHFLSLRLTAIQAGNFARLLIGLGLAHDVPPVQKSVSELSDGNQCSSTSTNNLTMTTSGAPLDPVETKSIAPSGMSSPLTIQLGTSESDSAGEERNPISTTSAAASTVASSIGAYLSDSSSPPPQPIRKKKRKRPRVIPYIPLPTSHSYEWCNFRHLVDYSALYGDEDLSESVPQEVQGVGQVTTRSGAEKASSASGLSSTEHEPSEGGASSANDTLELFWSRDLPPLKTKRRSYRGAPYCTQDSDLRIRPALPPRLEALHAAVVQANVKAAAASQAELELNTLECVVAQSADISSGNPSSVSSSAIDPQQLPLILRNMSQQELRQRLVEARENATRASREVIHASMRAEAEASKAPRALLGPADLSYWVDEFEVEFQRLEAWVSLRQYIARTCEAVGPMAEHFSESVEELRERCERLQVHWGTQLESVPSFVSDNDESVMGPDLNAIALTNEALRFVESTDHLIAANNESIEWIAHLQAQAHDQLGLQMPHSGEYLQPSPLTDNSSIPQAVVSSAQSSRGSDMSPITTPHPVAFTATSPLPEASSPAVPAAPVVVASSSVGSQAIEHATLFSPAQSSEGRASLTSSSYIEKPWLDFSAPPNVEPASFSTAAQETETLVSGPTASQDNMRYAAPTTVSLFDCVQNAPQCLESTISVPTQIYPDLPQAVSYPLQASITGSAMLLPTNTGAGPNLLGEYVAAPQTSHPVLRTLNDLVSNATAHSRHQSGTGVLGEAGDALTGGSFDAARPLPASTATPLQLQTATASNLRPDPAIEVKPAIGSVGRLSRSLDVPSLLHQHEDLTEPIQLNSSVNVHDDHNQNHPQDYSTSSHDSTTVVHSSSPGNISRIASMPTSLQIWHTSPNNPNIPSEGSYHPDSSITQSPLTSFPKSDRHIQATSTTPANQLGWVSDSSVKLTSTTAPAVGMSLISSTASSSGTAMFNLFELRPAPPIMMSEETRGIIQRELLAAGPAVMDIIYGYDM